jgi:hypothetical protein
MVRGEDVRFPDEMSADAKVNPFETVICLGPDEMHQRFAEYLGSRDALRVYA